MAKVSIWSTIATLVLCFFILQFPARAEPLHALSPLIPTSMSDVSRASWEEVEDPWEPSTKVEIAKIRSGVLPGVVIGGHYDGLLKIRQQRYVASGRLDEQLENSVYDLLENELSDAGFEVMRSHPHSLFAEVVESSEPGRFLIGGTITQEHLNSYSSFFNEYTNTERSIRWELFDRDANKIVYRQEIDGSAQVEGIDNPAATYEAIRASFRQLLHEPRFISVLNHPAPQDPPVPAKPYKIEAIASTSQPLTLEELVGRSIPSIVGIRTPTGRGSGFLLDSSGLIMTNEHVVGSAFSVKIRLYDGTTLNGHVLRRDTVSDAALVKLEGDMTNVSGLPICHTDVVRVGQSVVAIGNPLSLANTVTQGIVSGFRRNPSRSLIQTDTAVNPGNSGGPLLNRDGTVIGIVTEKIASEGIEGLGFALPIGEVLQRLNVSIDPPANSKLDSCGNPLMAYK
ncbi:MULTISPECIES: trypsin-like peptidase domain-containing protein [unclassified Leptolyngbya]|uniref:S1C family serine protease n=1 Tax=unclassified Leptolyngbya TaxID=2650499 RepID=UPI0016835ED6|nr:MULTISPECIES: trypsin-like peptidase domain-containing protein [unclassified Leptolyngbya]MBD1911720.1 trypsin-like peptidase domain-containing protein [Leptolyngbya sp. FACHB-8]MBD2155555.1 trypsin-like peptidase domain-containing protein [Leptolyngbya sp. FACHB-16]